MNATRTPVPGTVKVLWTDTGGVRHEVRGRCFNISERGMGMELRQSIPHGISVRVKSPLLALDTVATVCHSGGADGHYSVGVQFLGGKRWSHEMGALVHADW